LDDAAVCNSGALVKSRAIEIFFGSLASRMNVFSWSLKNVSQSFYTARRFKLLYYLSIAGHCDRKELGLWERRFFSAMHILICNIRFQTMKLLF
jgi:hypothetical protein